MTLGKEFLFFLSGLGAFNGFILGVFFLFFAKQKGRAKIFLAFLLLALSVRIGKSVVLSFQDETSRHLLQFGLSACFLIGPSLFLYLKTVRGEKVDAPKWWLSPLVLSFIFIIGAGLLYPYQREPVIWNAVIVKIIYLQWTLFVLASAVLIRDLFASLFRSFKELSPKDRWLLSVWFANAAVLACYLVSYFVNSFPFYISGALIFSALTYLMVFYLFILRKGEAIFSDRVPIRRGFSDSENRGLFDRLNKLMLEDSIHHQADLKLAGLAEKLGTSSHRLSQLLNEDGRGGFSSFINMHRINDAQALISSMDHLTLEGIGYEVGFNSKSAFYSAFKKVTGITPAAYKKRAKMETKSQE